MALTTARIIGRDVAITCDGSKTIWSTATLDFNSTTEDATAADSTISEDVFTTKRLKLTLTGLLGSVNNGGTLPAVGATISDLAVKVGTDSILPDLTDYTDIKVTDVKYEAKKGPATWSVEAMSGLLK